MERLTKWNEYGNADIIALSDIMPELYAELSFLETNPLTDASNRLAAYEDTEMTPNEILQIKKDYRSLQERLNQNNKLLNKALGRPCRSCDYGNVYCSPIGYCPFYD